MFLLLATALLQQPSPDYLAIDGVVVGMLEGSRWTLARSLSAPTTLGMSEVGVGIASGRSANVRLSESRMGPWIEASGFPTTHVLFTGKSWLPRPCLQPLERSDVIPTVAQLARNRGVSSPQPYLLHVWDIDLDGDGTKEQIIEAVSNHRDPTSSPWEATLLRWRDDRQERVYPLSISFPGGGQPAARCKVRAVADFDGDGQIEVVSSATGDGFLFATIWSFKEGKLIPLLDASMEMSSAVEQTRKRTSTQPSRQNSQNRWLTKSVLDPFISRRQRVQRSASQPPERTVTVIPQSNVHATHNPQPSNHIPHSGGQLPTAIR